MNIKICKGKPEFSEVGHDKNTIWVQFPNCISLTTKKPFKWFPTYKQLCAIYMKLDEIEKESWGKDVQ